MENINERNGKDTHFLGLTLPRGREPKEGTSMEGTRQRLVTWVLVEGSSTVHSKGWWSVVTAHQWKIPLWRVQWRTLLNMQYTLLTAVLSEILLQHVTVMKYCHCNKEHYYGHTGVVKMCCSLIAWWWKMLRYVNKACWWAGLITLKRRTGYPTNGLSWCWNPYKHHG